MVSHFKKFSNLLVVVVTTFLLVITLDYDNIVYPKADEIRAELARLRTDRAARLVSARQVLIEFNRECVVETGFAFLAGEEDNVEAHLSFIGDLRAVREVVCNGMGDRRGFYEDTCLTDDDDGVGLTHVTIEKYMSMLIAKGAVAFANAPSLQLADWLDDPLNVSVGATYWNEKYYAEELYFGVFANSSIISLERDPVRRVLCTRMIRDVVRIGSRYFQILEKEADYEADLSRPDSDIKSLIPTCAVVLGVTFFFLIVLEPNEGANLRLHFKDSTLRLFETIILFCLEISMLLLSDSVYSNQNSKPGIKILFVGFVVFFGMIFFYYVFHIMKACKYTPENRVKANDNDGKRDLLIGETADYLMDQLQLSSWRVEGLSVRESLWLMAHVTSEGDLIEKPALVRLLTACPSWGQPAQQSFEQMGNVVVEMVKTDQLLFPRLLIHKGYMRFLVSAALLLRGPDQDGSLGDPNIEELRRAFELNFLHAPSQHCIAILDNRVMATVRTSGVPAVAVEDAVEMDNMKQQVELEEV